MGGGHLTRPELYGHQPDPSHPMTEFYLLLQAALARQGEFALPGLYARFQAPARRIYADEVREFCAIGSVPQPEYAELLPPTRLHLLYDELRVTPKGEPAALMLTETGSRSTCAVQLLPPFVWPDPLPPVPPSTCALTLALRQEDLFLADQDPGALGAQLAMQTAQKAWTQHPRLDRWLAERLAVMQRVYRR